MTNRNKQILQRQIELLKKKKIRYKKGIEEMYKKRDSIIYDDKLGRIIVERNIIHDDKLGRIIVERNI